MHDYIHKYVYVVCQDHAVANTTTKGERYRGLGMRDRHGEERGGGGRCIYNPF